MSLYIRPEASKERGRVHARESYRARKGGKVRVYRLRGPHLCSGCDQAGHNVRSCPEAREL